MTKSTITREQLIKKAQEQIEFCRHTKITGEGRAHVNQCAALFEIALAAMDSEPVAYISKSDFDAGYPHILARRDFNKACTMAVYAAQPAPIVPEEKPIPNTLSMYAVDAVAAIAEVNGWNACRAAMLERQLVDRVDEKSLTSINPAPDLVSLQKKAESIIGNYPGIPDGYVMVPKEPTKEMIDAGWLHYMGTKNPSSKGTYKAMLAAAPQSPGGDHATVPGKWIPVSERMPEREVDVQVYCPDKKEQMVAYLERNELEGYFRFATWRTGDGIYCQPTHWMPLPAAPQEGK